MRREIWLGKRNLRFYYYRYKDSPYYSFVLFIVIAIVCLVLLFNVVVPQFSNWFSIRNEVIATTNRIDIIKNNIQFMNALDKSTIDSQLQIASTAVPINRDFEFILNSISDAAARSVVSIDDFNFQVGDIDTTKRQTIDPAYKGFSVIRISLVAHGNFENVRRFIQAISEKLPLSEVVSMNGSSGGVAIVLQFYQKPLPNISIKNDVPLSDISPAKKELIQKLSSWKSEPQFAPDIMQAPSSASNSATDGPLPLF